MSNALTQYRKRTTKSVHRGRTTIACKLGSWTTNSLCASKANRVAEQMYKAKAESGFYKLILKVI